MTWAMFLMSNDAMQVKQGLFLNVCFLIQIMNFFQRMYLWLWQLIHMMLKMEFIQQTNRYPVLQKSKFALIAHLNFCQIVGERLAIAGLNIAYGMTDLPTNGPFFTNIDIETMPDGNFSITIDYDQSFEYDSSETNGFYVCCDYDMLECDEHCGRWQLVRYEDTISIL